MRSQLDHYWSIFQLASQNLHFTIEEKNQFPEISIRGNRMKLPKLDWVRFTNSRDVHSRIANATMRKKPLSEAKNVQK